VRRNRCRCRLDDLATIFQLRLDGSPFQAMQMNIKAFFAKIDHVIAVYQDVGLAGTGSRLLLRIRQLFGSDDPAHAAWLKQKTEADMAFDATTGTETGGIQEIFEMNIVGDNARHGVSHIASDPDRFAEMIERLDVDLGDYTFVDLGSGKGRAIMLAAAYSFRRLIGVEFAAELHQAAKGNIARLASKTAIIDRIELVHEDAAAYEFPAEPLIVYMFNPFSSVIVGRVAKNLLTSWKASPRPIQVLYAYPLHVSEFTAAGWLLEDGSSDPARLTPPK